MKRIARKIAASKFVAPLWAPLARGRVSIFTLHRFAVPDLNVPGHDPGLLRRTLERLWRDGYKLLGLTEVLEALRCPSKSIGRAVAFTVDDGYADFALAGADTFLAYDCPVTVFVVTGFVDGQLWPWWDQIEFICLGTDKPSIELAIGGRPMSLDLHGPAQRNCAARSLWARCKEISEQEKWEVISQLAAAAEVELPRTVPERYLPMSWADARALEARGIRFGPHTVSHPVLARTTGPESAREISQSWEAVRRHIDSPVPIFAYPNGAIGDYGPREIETLRRCGLAAALTSNARFATRATYRQSPDGPYETPRFAYPGDPDRVCLIASGLSRITNVFRRIAEPKATACHRNLQEPHD